MMNFRNTSPGQPEKPGEVPVPGKNPEIVPTHEPTPGIPPAKEPEINPGREPLTQPGTAPPEIPRPPAYRPKGKM